MKTLEAQHRTCSYCCLELRNKACFKRHWDRCPERVRYGYIKPKPEANSTRAFNERYNKLGIQFHKSQSGFSGGSIHADFLKAQFQSCDTIQDAVKYAHELVDFGLQGRWDCKHTQQFVPGQLISAIERETERSFE